MSNISELIGKTIIKFDVDDNQENIYIETSDGDRYRMNHSQDCCESVYIESIVGDIEDIVGSPILAAEEVVSHDDDITVTVFRTLSETQSYDESFTWTFYKLATIKGSIDIRWYGSSNGYYSESVDFVSLNF
jgi:hypothetical protein